MKLASMGLKRSKMFLKLDHSERIVYAVLDLLKSDSEWSTYNFTFESLMLQALEFDPTIRALFHPNFQIGNFIENLQSYFIWFSLGINDYTNTEDLLLGILAHVLKRTINLIPIINYQYQHQVPKVFGNFEESFSIFAYRYSDRSFYISATKLEG